MLKYLLIIFSGLIGFSPYLHAQEVDSLFVKKSQILILSDRIIAPTQDTLILVDKDEKHKVRRNPYKTSKDFYQIISEKSSANKITKKFADLFIVRTDKKTDQAAESGLSNDIQFSQYEGLIIRTITIKHVDILEGSVFDTARVSSGNLAAFANKTHIDSRDFVIRSNLRIKDGQRIDPVLLADNERILRSVGYIEDAKFYILPNQDDYSADIILFIKDRLSWGFEGHINNQNQGDFRIFNRNIVGIGRYTSIGSYYSRNQSHQLGYDFRAGGQNSLKAFNSWEFNKTNYWDRDDAGLVVQKDFLSQSIKYGGGLELRTVRDSTLYLDGELGKNNYYHLNFQDVWFGRSFIIPSKYGRKNLVLAGRVLNNDFQSRPPTGADSNSLYFNRVLVLGQVGYAKQRFLKASYVLGFGISEDIPVGFRLSGIYGRDFNEFYSQHYLGAQFFWSRYFKSIGYFYLSHELGSYLRDSFTEGALRTKLSYFAPLIVINRTRIRTFLNFGLDNGLHQPPSQTITLSSRIRDITGGQIAGNRLFYLRSEAILFTPWYFLGFRFAPFVFGTLSHVSDERISATSFSNNFLSGGLGIRLKNESLVFNTFEARLTNFFVAPKGASNNLLTISVSAPISFGNIFKYKPTLIPFE